MVKVKLDIGPVADFLAETPLHVLIGYMAIGALCFAFVYNYISVWRLRAIPGPTPLPIVGHIPYLLKEPWFQFDRWAQQFGEIYKFFIWGNPMVVITDPDDVKKVLQEERHLYPKDAWSYEYFRPVLGFGLVTSEGDRWRKQRQILAPKFHFGSLERLLPIFVGAADRVCTRWAKTSQVELGTEFRSVTLEVISEVALGLSPSDANVLPHIFEAVLDELNQRMFQPWRAFMPLEIEHRRSIRKLDTLVAELIKSRRAAFLAHNDGSGKETSSTNLGSPKQRGNDTHVPKASQLGGDMLDMLLESNFDMDDTQLADELKTMLLAGHETSSMMLLWSCYLLCKHPEKLEVALNEVHNTLGPAVEGKWGTYEQYKNLAYLDQVMFEAMRLYAPVPVLTRCTISPVQLKNTTVPENTKIAISVWAMHRNEKIWGKDALEFRPERFSPEESRGRHPYAYMPFSLGPRNCIGRNLAMIEAKVILATILQRFKLNLSAGQPDNIPTDCYIIPVRPAGGLYMDVSPRVKSDN